LQEHVTVLVFIYYLAEDKKKLLQIFSSELL